MGAPPAAIRGLPSTWYKNISPGQSDHGHPRGEKPPTSSVKMVLGIGPPFSCRAICSHLFRTLAQACTACGDRVRNKWADKRGEGRPWATRAGSLPQLSPTVRCLGPGPRPKTTKMVGPSLSCPTFPRQFFFWTASKIARAGGRGKTPASIMSTPQSGLG